MVRASTSVRKADRDFNIEPPASPYAIMRRAYYRGENSGPGKDIVGEVTQRPGIGEHQIGAKRTFAEIPQSANIEANCCRQ